jgi:flavin-dependent dehydrogenase
LPPICQNTVYFQTDLPSALPRLSSCFDRIVSRSIGLVFIAGTQRSMVRHDPPGDESFRYDVVICGGGLAGLTLARQLRMQLPEMSVALVERTVRPLPLAAHKVGESSVEVGAHYFGKVLELEEYLRANHLPKFGLRFFIGDPHDSFSKRWELGQVIFPPTPAYQLDRGRLENDLREMLIPMGVAMWEGYSVDDIVFGADGQPHRIAIGNELEQRELHAHWVVDAQGRRRFLQRKLRLQAPSGHTASAAWWRVSARVDVSEFVPATDRAWHKRVVESRYFSTNHMMGRGYWVWLIPLSSGMTSVGIVTDETMHPFRTYGTEFKHALEWLKVHEPVVFEAVKDLPPADFLGLRNFSYHSKQAFSVDRWSCVGEAAVFADPFYSPGSDFIAAGNGITTSLINRYFRGSLSAEVVDLYNHIYLDLLAVSSYAIYAGTYATFGHAQVYGFKLLWDATSYWSIWAQIFFQKLYDDPQALAELCPLMERSNLLGARMQRLFIDWAERTEPRNSSHFVDMAMCGPLLPMLHFDLHTTRTGEECIAAMKENLLRMEELAQAMFFVAARECCAEHARRLPNWVNAWAIGLDPSRWEQDGLERPASAPRDLDVMIEHLRVLNGQGSRFDKLKLAVAGSFVRAFRGRLSYAASRLLIRCLLRGRPGLTSRRLLYRRLFKTPKVNYIAPPLPPLEPQLPFGRTIPPQHRRRSSVGGGEKCPEPASRGSGREVKPPSGDSRRSQSSPTLRPHARWIRSTE